MTALNVAIRLSWGRSSADTVVVAAAAVDVAVAETAAIMSEVVD